jgi:dipeptidase E
MTNLLLLSNSTLPGTPFFTWPRPFVKDFLGNQDIQLVFIPYAAVTIPWSEYANIVSEAFKELGYTLTSIHEVENPREAIESAAGIVTGGGNTFHLLNELCQRNLLEPIREKIHNGFPYIGWSAGANLACPTIMTTNDMPIVQPSSFNALKLVPFQLNPHYHELRFEGQGGESRKERLEEFLVCNPERKVIGLPEGMLIERQGNNLMLKGTGTAKVYQYKQPVSEVSTGTDISYLL